MIFGRRRKKLPITAVGELTDSDDIAGAFSRYYNTLYNSVDLNHDDMRSLYNDVSDSICNCTDNHSHKITESDIGDAIRKLKSGKGDGYDGLTSDYLINGTQLLFYYLSTLFSLFCYLTALHLRVSVCLLWFQYLKRAVVPWEIYKTIGASL